MRALGVFMLFGCCLLVTPIVQADEFPYRATVQTDDAVTMSGPGAEFYPTAKLHRGEEVEVYRLDPGGWCAIRPSQESFSYVNALNLTANGPHRATVTADRVPARVGSQLNEQRETIHVYLKQGEIVELRDTFRDTTTGETWCKIAPPDGEFRWVHNKNFVAAPAPLAVTPATDGSEATEPPSRYKNKQTLAQADIFKSDSPKPDTIKPDVATPVESGKVVLAGTTEGWVAVDNGQRTPITTYSTGNSASGKNGVTRPANGSESNGASDGRNVQPVSIAMQFDLDQVDVAISRIIVQDPARWEFTAIRQRTDALYDRSTSNGDRVGIRAMLNKIDRYDELHKRNVQVSQVRDTRGARPVAAVPMGATFANNTPPVVGPAFPVGYEPSTIPASISTSAVALNPGAAPPGTYDSIGRLTPVHSRRTDAPTFALIDPRGDVITFITPAPGVDLAPFVGREVGVNGARGYIPEFKRPHLTAQRATVLR